MVEKTERLPVLCEKALVDAIDDYRFRNRIGSRSSAIRELIKRGLKPVGTAPEARGEVSVFALRLPEGMRARLKVMAAERGVSMNSLIVSILERAILGPAPAIEKGAA